MTLFYCNIKNCKEKEYILFKFAEKSDIINNRGGIVTAQEYFNIANELNSLSNSVDLTIDEI